MIKAILLDLDNTLLHNPDKAFAYAFLDSLTQHFQRVYGYKEAGKSHRESLKYLAQPHHVTVSNAARMADYFQQASHLTADEVRSTWADFYRDIYPSLLDSFIQPVPYAAEMIYRLRDEGYALVIATNPIYPEPAILARMAKAGLPIETGVYALVTGAEIMHYPKSDPAYYAEIIGRIGVEPDEALMVGDSLTNDIQPSYTLGLHTFHITSETLVPLQGSFNGTLDDFSALIHDTEWLGRLSPFPLKADMIAPQYRGNIAALLGMLENVQPDYWDKRPDPNEWSILQILCHLLDSENTDQRLRLERIQREDNPFIVAPHPSGPDLPVCHPSGPHIAHQFVEARQKTLDFIATLQPSDWQRPARHSVFGLTTLLEMAHFTAQHDRLHLNQVCQTIGRCVNFS